MQPGAVIDIHLRDEIGLAQGFPRGGFPTRQRILAQLEGQG